LNSSSVRVAPPAGCTLQEECCGFRYIGRATQPLTQRATWGLSSCSHSHQDRGRPRSSCLAAAVIVVVAPVVITKAEGRTRRLSRRSALECAQTAPLCAPPARTQGRYLRGRWLYEKAAAATVSQEPGKKLGVYFLRGHHCIYMI
jgi:hypothetical protein